VKRRNDEIDGANAVSGQLPAARPADAGARIIP